MFNKVKELFGSKRFWLITVGALAAIGSAWSGETLTLELGMQIITGWSLAVAGVGTIDKFSNK